MGDRVLRAVEIGREEGLHYICVGNLPGAGYEDTHYFLWFIAGSEQLSATARALIEDESNQVFLSVGSLWEMAIKASLGRLQLAQPFEILIPEHLRLNSISLLNITVKHAVQIAAMPFHHRDPFDRLLVAQAQVEGMQVVGLDAGLDAYGINRLW